MGTLWDNYNNYQLGMKAMCVCFGGQKNTNPEGI